MKTNDLYTTVSALSIFEPFVYRLAEISAKSTLKFLEQKEQSNMIHALRLGITRDCKYLETLSRISEDERTEYKRDCLREEVRLNNREASAIKRRMKKEQDENELEKLNWRLAEIEAENDTLNFEIQKISDYLARIQPIISDTLSPNSFDLVNVARWSILYALQFPTANSTKILEILQSWNDIYTTYTLDDFKKKVLDEVMTATKDIIVAKKKLKTKEGYTLYTLKGFADQMVRNRINRMRSGIASKTNFLITGYDKDGNELYIQADIMTTDGGITDIFRANEFKDFRNRLNLTELENILARLLMEGKTEEQIGKRFGVSHQAIHKRIQKLRDKLNSIEEVQNMRRYHNNNTK